MSQQWGLRTTQRLKYFKYSALLRCFTELLNFVHKQPFIFAFLTFFQREQNIFSVLHLPGSSRLEHLKFCLQWSGSFSVVGLWFVGLFGFISLKVLCAALYWDLFVYMLQLRSWLHKCFLVALLGIRCISKLAADSTNIKERRQKKKNQPQIFFSPGKTFKI